MELRKKKSKKKYFLFKLDDKEQDRGSTSGKYQTTRFDQISK